MLDLFSGIGGFTYAAQLLGGFRTLAFVENDPFCKRVLNKNWPDIPVCGDVCNYIGCPGVIDVITAGFPCQDISIAGKGAGIHSTTRSGLFYEIIRLAGSLRPRFIVLENVSAIIANEHLGTVLGSLAEAGFDAEWACIRASDLGACHRRDRWWCVAYSNDSGLEGREPAGVCQHSRQWIAGPRDPSESGLKPDWRAFASEPVLCRGNDGLSGRVDRLRALGNAVVPQVAMVPLRRVKALSGLGAV